MRGTPPRPSDDERGQAFALEGIIAAVIVASALILGIQAVDIEPLTSGNERTNEELRTQVADALEVASETGERFGPADEPGALREAATCVGRDEDGNIVPNPSAADPESGAAFGSVLGASLEEDTSYRVLLEYPNASASDGVRTAVLVNESIPRIDSVTVTRQIPLYDSDKIRGTESCDTLSGEPTLEKDLSIGFYVEEDQHSDSELYAVVQIRVIAWR